MKELATSHNFVAVVENNKLTVARILKSEVYMKDLQLELIKRFKSRLLECSDDFFMGDLTHEEAQTIRDYCAHFGDFTKTEIKSESEVSEDESFHHLFCVFASK
jgi:hypothetical protein